MKVFIGLVLCAVVVFFKLVPLGPNFSPLLALGLWSCVGASSRGRALFYVPFFLLGALLGDYLGHGFYQGAWGVYISLGLVLLLGLGLQADNPSTKALAAVWSLGSFGAAGVFFLSSNFFVWLSSGMYPLTGGGLLQCYLAGVPFFRNSLFSTLIGGALLWGALLWSGRFGAHRRGVLLQAKKAATRVAH